MRSRWFECPCGTEWWTPSAGLGDYVDREVGRDPRAGLCWRCRTWLGRYVMYLWRAGT